MMTERVFTEYKTFFALENDNLKTHIIIQGGVTHDKVELVILRFGCDGEILPNDRWSGGAPLTKEEWRRVFKKIEEAHVKSPTLSQ